MKFLITVFLILPTVAFSDDFPINNVNVEVTKLEVWPSQERAGRYTARVSGIMPGGCTNSTGFVIEEGPGAEAAYSTLLAAVMAGKQVQVYLTRCAYWPVADRVRVIINFFLL